MDQVQGIKIYVDHNRTTIKGINLQMSLARFFLNNNIHRSLITIYDIANDFEKQSLIKNHSKKIPKYPYIEINGQLWGEGCMVEEKKQEVVELLQPLMNIIPENDKSEIVDAFMNSKQFNGASNGASQVDALHLGFVGSSINVTEWLLFGIVKGMWNTAWQASQEPTPEPEESDFECDVIRTNWYGRRQFRKYRFTPYKILRLGDGTVRTTLFYKDIKELVCQDKKNIILKIQDGEDQFIEAVEKDALKIIEIVTSRSYLSPSGDNTWRSPVIA